MADDPWQPTIDPPAPKRTVAQRIVLALLIVCVGGPLLLFGGLRSVFFLAETLNTWQNSGTATGNAALARAGKYLGPAASAFLGRATNARGEWLPPDFHGDDSQYYAFDLPVADVPAFERAIVADWSGGPNYRGPGEIASMPLANNDPSWMQAPMPNGAFYERGFESIGVSRSTGHILVRHWAW